MKRNMGGADRALRILVALVVVVLFYNGIIEGTLAYVLLAVSSVFVLTSLVSFCPLYRLIGTSTCKAV